MKFYPNEKDKRTWERFGGIVKYINGNYYVLWNIKNLKNYIKFILFHEVGHSVYFKKYGKLGTGSQEEKFCDEYAEFFLNKPSRDEIGGR